MKVKELKSAVSGIKQIKEDVFLISFNAPYLAKVSLPGQFIHIKIKSVILRRPFSIHRVVGDKIFILFRVRGRGTAVLSQYKKGEPLDIIGPLGQGFDINRTTNILVAGGMGVAPLVFLAEKLNAIRNTVLLGGKNKGDIFCEQEFKKLGFQISIATEDGSKGTKGTVLDILESTLLTIDYRLSTNIYACGPKEMFYEMSKILKKYPDINCQVSFEQFMGCGLGVCCGCTIETKEGYKKVCKDGPVFDLRSIW